MTAPADSSIVVITPKSLDEARGLSNTLSKSALLPDALRGKEADILMTVLTGAELGLAPMQSIRAIDVIKGKPTLKAEAMVALVRRRRDVCEYLVLRESTATKCTYETKRAGDPSPTTMSFTVEDARAAGLLGNDNYKRFPAAMLRARCGSAICKAVYSDLLLGVYDPDELEPQRSERDVTPRASPPSNVVDSTATAAPAPDYDANGAPVSETAKLEVAIAEAQTQGDLDKLVERIGRLKGANPKAYASLRTQWGARRDELKSADVSARFAAASAETEAKAITEPGAEG